MIELRGVSSGYSSVTVLYDVELSVAKGQRVAMIGPNGAGKTTLLETISGFVGLRSGTIKFDGADLAGLKPEQRAERGIALVTERRNLFMDMTVAENLYLGRSAAPTQGRWSKGEVQAATDRVMKLFPKLKQLYKGRVGLLSGGEQQMVAIGRALIAQPKLLMLDEPSQGLAPKVVETVYDALSAISDEMAVLLVEQDLQIALAGASSIFLMLNGRLRKLSAEEAMDEEFMAKELLGSQPL